MTATPALPQIKLFLDGAELEQMKRAYADPRISGFTTNPTLMRKAGISDYAGFARAAIEAMPDKPISFEVFSDSLAEMEREARIIHSWGGNTYVKIPVTNTAGLSTAPLIRKLSAEGIALNVTAIMTLPQVSEVAEALDVRTRSIVSVFAGRIADTGVDPEPLMGSAVEILQAKPAAELLWASPRELLNLFHAARVGCSIITATSDVLVKLGLIGKDLTQYSLETVKMFYTDAVAAGFKI
jgi:transaldolase